MFSNAAEDLWSFAGWKRRVAQGWNTKLYKLYDAIDIVQRVKIQQLRQLGHDVRMYTNDPALEVFDAIPAGGSKERGRPLLHSFKDQVGMDLVSLGVSNFRRLAREINDWRDLLNSAKVA